MLKVRCIYTDGSRGLTVGKVYEVRCENGFGATDYFLVGIKYSYLKTKFVVVGCKCGINNCISHRAKI